MHIMTLNGLAGQTRPSVPFQLWSEAVYNIEPSVNNRVQKTPGDYVVCVCVWKRDREEQAFLIATFGTGRDSLGNVFYNGRVQMKAERERAGVSACVCMCVCVVCVPGGLRRVISQ